MYKIKFDNDVYDLPSTWNELTKDQFLLIAGQSMSMTGFAAFRIKLALGCFGFRIIPRREEIVNGVRCFYLGAPEKKMYLVDVDELALVVEKLSWIFTHHEQSNEYVVNSRLTLNLLPAIKVGKQTWYGPMDALTNITFSEYIHAETAFYYLHKKRDESFINRLIAVLYRPQIEKYDPESIDYRGDRREFFNDFLLDQRQQKVVNVDPKVKQGILLWYTGCRAYLEHKFPEALGSSGEGEKASGDVFMNFMKMVNALTNNDVTKNNELRSAYMYEVLITMEALAVQDRKMKELYKK